MFTFEQFRKHQLRMLYEQNNLATDHLNLSTDIAPIEVPISELENSVQLQSNTTKSNYEGVTFAMNERHVEGYLLKEISTDHIFRKSGRNLRYFRIVFSTGKLNIKECRDAKNMRSFELRELTEVKVMTQDLRNLRDIEPKQSYARPLNQKVGISILVKSIFDIDEVSPEPNWPFRFYIDFPKRRFELSARSKHEMVQWVRIFRLIIQLNKIGVSVVDQNPFKFEVEHRLDVMLRSER